jgi:hypothetical protein
VHLTNDAVQKKASDYGKFEAGNKLSYVEFQESIDRQRRGEGQGDVSGVGGVGGGSSGSSSRRGGVEVGGGDEGEEGGEVKAEDTAAVKAEVRATADGGNGGTEVRDTIIPQIQHITSESIKAVAHAINRNNRRHAFELFG